MIKAYLVEVLLFLCALLVPCFAQIQSPNAETAARRTVNKSESATEPTSSIIFQKRGMLSFRKRVSREQKKRLAPDAADLKRYELFLQQPKTGLIKLLPDLGCEENAAVVRADETCLNAVPMSAFYSFREKEYTNDFLSDIRLKNDFLITDGLLAQGVLVALGDAALETVTPTSDGMKFLNEFTPEARGSEALKQTKQLIKGIKSGRHFYRKSLPAEENTTYALRAVAYRGSILQSVHGRAFDMLAGDKRVDIIVAFRVIKRDDAGSLTLLWKELQRKDAPKIVFPKRGRKSI